MLTSTYCKSSIAVLSLAGLVACGGGATSTGTQQTYAGFADVSATTPSPITGHIIATNEDTGQDTVAVQSGTLAHDTGVLSVAHTGYSFVTPSGGFTATGVMSDGQGATAQVVPGFANGYDYVLVYNGEYQAGGSPYDTLGVIGIPTQASDMPTGQTAIYVGTAALVAQTQNGLTQTYSNGTTTLTVDYGQGTAVLTLDGFQVTDPTGTVITGTFDTVVSNDITINGANMSSGTLVFSANGATVNVTGANATNAVSGSFYGLDGTIPDEAGGVILATGDTGHVSGVFVAD